MVGMSPDIQPIKKHVLTHTDTLERNRTEIRRITVVRRFDRFWFSFSLLFGLCFTSCSVANFGDGDDAELLFAKRVLPLLKEKCFTCHGNMPGDHKAELDMRTLESMLRGGETGEASIVIKDPKNSPIYLAVTRSSDEWSAMPPKESERLSDEQVGWVHDWIAAGAP